MDNLSRENLDYLLNTKLKPKIDAKMTKDSQVIAGNGSLFVCSGTTPSTYEDVIFKAEKYCEIDSDGISWWKGITHQNPPYEDEWSDYQVASFDFEDLRKLQTLLDWELEYEFKRLKKWETGFAHDWFIYFNGGPELVFDYYNILSNYDGQGNDKHYKINVTSVTPVQMGDQDPDNIGKKIEFYRDVEKNGWYVKPVSSSTIYGYYDVAYTVENLYEEDDEWEQEWITWWDDYNAGYIVR